MAAILDLLEKDVPTREKLVDSFLPLAKVIHEDSSLGAFRVIH